MKVAVFPGSFDPITIGHLDIILRALPLFDKIIIAIGVNTKKQYLFSLEQRKEWINAIFSNEPKIEVKDYTGLTIDFVRNEGAQFMLRGLRSAGDFDYERTIAQLNSSMYPDLETVFLVSKPEYIHISSTIVREIILAKGDAAPFLPDTIAEQVKM